MSKLFFFSRFLLIFLTNRETEAIRLFNIMELLFNIKPPLYLNSLNPSKEKLKDILIHSIKVILKACFLVDVKMAIMVLLRLVVDRNLNNC